MSWQKRVAEGVERIVDELAAKPKAAVRKAAPKPTKVTFPDEGHWDLPDLDENIPVYTAPVPRPASKVPAKAAPQRSKLGVFHGTKHRLKPEVKVRDIKTGEERFIESALGEPIRDVPANVEVVKNYPLGRFRMDKIGTGEGAQAYGHGLYFAEAPDVARKYRDDNLRYDAPNPTVGGEDIHHLYSRMLSQADALPPSEAQMLYDRGALLEDLMDKGDVLAIKERLAQDPQAYSPEVMNWFNRDIASKWDAPGALYQVEIDADPAKMLAWDQPLSEQPAVMNALAPLIQKYQIENLYNGRYPEYGGDVYHRLRFRSDARDSAMADMLKGVGIPGIRYLDQGSRVGGGDTQNYVVMDPDLIEIMKRYNVGGSVETEK